MVPSSAKVVLMPNIALEQVLEVVEFAQYSSYLLVSWGHLRL